MSVKLEQDTLSASFHERSEEARHGFELPTPNSVDDLTLSREREKKPVDIFLDEYHELGSIQGWYACFGARYRGYLVGVCILGRPYNPDTDTKTVYLTRFATRPDRPANTGSWLIARARKWCVLEGYNELVALAGISDNRGTVYSAAGFECQNEDDPDRGGGAGWQSRPGREAYSTFDKRRWVCDLEGYR